MKKDRLEKLADKIPFLEAVYISALPDCLLLQYWHRNSISWCAEEAATVFAELVRANHKILSSFDCKYRDLVITVESQYTNIIIQLLNEEFVAVFVFEESASLGLIRLKSSDLVKSLKAELPKYKNSKRHSGEQIIGFLQNHSADPNIDLLRVALRTQLTKEQLESADCLTDYETNLVEDAVCSIIGLKLSED